MPHIHELYDFTASAFVTYQDKVLLLHHKKLDLWLQPGGHIELDENPEEALWRELEEETGLTEHNADIVGRPAVSSANTDGTLQLPLPFSMNVHWFDDKHRHIDICYLLRSRTDRLRLEPDSSHAIGWFTKTEIDKKLAEGLMPKNVHDLCASALKAVA